MSPPKPSSSSSPQSGGQWNVNTPAFNPGASDFTPGQTGGVAGGNGFRVAASEFNPLAAQSFTPTLSSGDANFVYDPVGVRVRPIITGGRRNSELDEFDPTYPAPDVSALVEGMQRMGAGLEDVAGPYIEGASEEQLAEDDPTLAYPLHPQLHPQLGVDEAGYVAPHISTYYYQPGPVESVFDDLQFHLYAPSLPHQLHRHPNQWSIHDFFMDQSLREELTRRSHLIYKVVDPASDMAKTLPAELHSYHSLYPLPTDKSHSNKIFGYTSHVYKATSALDGMAYALRRIEGFYLHNQMAMSTLDAWTRIQHPGIISVREAFTSKAFHDDSLVFVFDFYPHAKTLLSHHFTNSIITIEKAGGMMGAKISTLPPGQTLNGQSSGSTTVAPVPVTEPVLWSYTVQLVSALKAIHDAGLACRILEPTKILLTGKNRLRINCVGIFDLITYDGKNDAMHFQQDDLLSLGQLLICLACNSLASLQDIPSALEFIAHSYPPDLKKVILYLLSAPNPMKNINDVVTMLAPRIMEEMNATRSYGDFLEGELSTELENGRLVRLLCKLGFINERPEFGVDLNWSETGDRYPLKLFRDYVFHQVDPMGTPVLDMAHVIECLNKLDAGSHERILLASRDEQSCLIASYRDLKRCAELAINELRKK